MARSRNIKPGLYKNDQLAECSVWARYVFPGLWMLADREGRLEDRPKRIKAELLPFDTQDVEPLLRELAEKTDEQGVPFIVRYQNEDGRFIQISKFKTHQTPHYSEKASVIKPQSLQEKKPHTSGGNSGSDGGTKGSELQEPSGKQPAIKRGSQPPDSLIPDSLVLNPDSPIPDSPKPEKVKNAAATPRAGPESDDPIFGPYIAMMQRKGVDSRHARSFIGLMRKVHGDTSVLQVLGDCEREDITQPLPWIKATLEARGGKANKQEALERRNRENLKDWTPPEEVDANH